MIRSYSKAVFLTFWIFAIDSILFTSSLCCYLFACLGSPIQNRDCISHCLTRKLCPISLIVNFSHKSTEVSTISGTRADYIP